VSIEPTSTVLRGQSLRIKGAITSQPSGCGDVVIDLWLALAGKRVASGATVTNAKGEFTTTLVVPSDLPVGTYELVAKTPGTKGCPAASTQ
jgi:hypothetical protein